MRWSALLIVACLAGCSGTRAEDAKGPSPAPPAPPLPPARILVLGDTQLGNAFKAAPSLTTWRTARLDTADLASRLSEALRDARPTNLVHTGDLVDLNESAVLEVLDGSGNVRERMKQPLEEWRPVLSVFPREPALFPVVGNHERYGELAVSAVVGADDDTVDIKKLKLTKQLKPAEVYRQTIARFPHLAGAATFHRESGSYYATFPRFCLLSLDGADFDDDPTLFTFVDEKLGACHAHALPAVVMMHYPLFSGRPRAEDDSLELHAVRERLIDTFTRHRVALVITGHEHFYLRYLAEGRRLAGYPANLPPRPIYMTVSDFVNPYSRKLERIDPAAAGDGVRYFRGTHYAVIEVGDAGISVTVHGYRPREAKWETIDSFAVPP